MAYGVKYRIGWRGDRRERLEYDIQILERDYTGSVTEAYLMGDGVVLTYGKQDDDELVPFKPSTATLSLFCNDEQADFSDLYTSDPLKYKVLIGEHRNSMLVLRWVGYISTGRYARPWGRTPFKVTIEANDGMEALMNIPYQVDSTTRHTDTLTIRGLLERLVEPLGVWTVNMSSIPKISPSQTEDSADVIGIAANAIYEAFNNEVPSHYDLLIAVLRHFGLQAYFEGEKLCVRSVLGLASLSRPDWAGSLESSFGQTPLTFVPLESTMSVEAELSMLPPVRGLEGSDSDNDAVVIPSAVDPERWTQIFPSNGYPTVYARRDSRGLIVGSPTAELFPTGCIYYRFDGKLREMPDLNIEMTFYDISPWFNRGSDPMSILPILIPANGSISMGGSYTYPSLIVPEGAMRWRVDGEIDAGGEWVSLPETSETSELNKAFNEGIIVEFVHQSVARDIAIRRPIESLNPTDVNISLSRFSNNVEYNLLLLLREVDGGHFRARLSSISLTSDERTSTRFISVSNQGSEVIEYKDEFAESEAHSIFSPSIIDVENNTVIERYLSPAISSQMIRVLGAKLRDMRSAVTRQLDGEVVVARPLSLNTLWSDNSGSAYYTNYIRMMLKRGGSEVQLRELFPLREKSVWTMNTSMANARYVSNDSTALAYIPSDTTGIYLLMPSSRSYSKLARALTISKGVDSMIAVRTSVTDSADYSLTAYGDGGVILSELASLSNIMVILTLAGGKPTPSISIASATSYDATTGMWVIPEISGSTCKIYLADATGSPIAKHTITGEGTIRRVVVISGGFVVVDYISAGNIKTTSYYYNLYGELESYTDICSASEELVDMNDVYAFLYQGTTSIALREIKLARSEMLKGPVLFAGSKNALSYVDMNCALVLLRNSLGEAVIHDGRTGNRVVVSDGTQGAAQRYMLIGECVYAPDGFNMYETRILEGME